MQDLQVVKQQQRKLKHWIELSFVLVGILLLLLSVFSWSKLGATGIWNWSVIQTITLVSWLIIGAGAQGVCYYTKGMCVTPIILIFIGVFFQIVKTFDFGRIISGIVILLLSLLIVVMVQRKVIRITKFWIIDRAFIARMVTYSYSVIIVLVTIGGLFADITRLELIYDVSTVFYCLLIVLLLIWNESGNLLKQHSTSYYVKHLFIFAFLAGIITSSYFVWIGGMGILITIGVSHNCSKKSKLTIIHYSDLNH